MLCAAQAQPGLRGARNEVVIRLLWDANLRRAEVVGLDVEHVSVAQGRLAVLGKGKRERRWLSLAPQTSAALSRYLDALGRPAAGPLLVSLALDRATPTGRRLSAGGLYRVVRSLARAAGVRVVVSPHRIRHSTTTDALDRLDGDVRTVRGYTRHASIETLLRYDDARRDDYGAVARGQASALDQAAAAPSPARKQALSSQPSGAAEAPPDDLDTHETAPRDAAGTGTDSAGPEARIGGHDA